MTGVTQTWLLLATPAVPLLLALLWPVPHLRRMATTLAPWAAAPALALALTALLTTGGLPLHLEAPAIFAGLELALDRTGLTFLLLTAVLWLVGGVFARSYHSDDPLRSTFFGFFLLTMAGNLGVIVAANVLSFYLFFLLMTFSAYGLVIHDRAEEAYRAGRIYMVLAIMADLALLAGLFSLGAAGTGAVPFGPELEVAWRNLGGVDRTPGADLTATLLILGFGVKAGLVPLHVWLPLAHPVAPTVASALLSGAMIKTGVLAWIRFLPTTLAFPELGAALMIAGVTATLYGVVLGLPHGDPKTVLAYSSVSQMGFMVVAAGVMIHEPGLATVASSAAAGYALHHGLAKGALFLSVGVVDRAPRWDRSRWRTAILGLALLPALAISGAPLTTGGRAKGTIERVLQELGGAWHHTLEPLLVAAALGSTLLLARFLVVLDRRGRAAEAEHDNVAPWGLLAPWVLLVVIGASALFWLPAAVPPSEPAPAILHAPLRALLPIFAGALVAWAVYRRPALPGPLTRLQVPSGDLVVPIEVLIRRITTAFRETVRVKVRPQFGRLDAALGAARERTVGAMEWLAERDMVLMRGALIGVIVFLLIAILAISNSRAPLRDDAAVEPIRAHM